MSATSVPAGLGLGATFDRRITGELYISWAGTVTPPPFDVSAASTFQYTHFRLTTLNYNNAAGPNVVIAACPGLGLKCAELAPPVDVYQVNATSPGGWRSTLIGSASAFYYGFFQVQESIVDSYHVSDYPRRLPGELTIVVTDDGGNPILGALGAGDRFSARLQFYNKLEYP
jgi:hypothetical protein